MFASRRVLRLVAILDGVGANRAGSANGRVSPKVVVC